MYFGGFEPMTPSAVWRLIPAKRWEVIALDIEALRKPRAQPVGVASWLQVPYPRPREIESEESEMRDTSLSLAHLFFGVWETLL